MSYDNEGRYHDDGPDVDREYDDMVYRVSMGEECPRCHGGHIVAAKALGMPLFHCRSCGTDWANTTEVAP